MLLGARRFSALAALVARIYGGYKLIQWTRGDGVRLARHHRRSAEGAYRLATRLEGLPIKVCQFVGSRADILPAEYVEVLSQLQSEEHTSELQSQSNLVCRLLLEKKKKDSKNRPAPTQNAIHTLSFPAPPAHDY